MNKKLRNILISAAILPGMMLGTSSIFAATNVKPLPQAKPIAPVVYIARLVPAHRYGRHFCQLRHRRFFNRHLSAGNVRTIVDARLIMHGNKYLTAGAINKTSFRGHSDFYQVNIVTKKGHELANRILVNGRNGRARRI